MARHPTVRELLSRVRWDREFGQGRFEIGYDDHARGIVRVPLEQIRIEEDNRFSFLVAQPSGEVLTIPFHRVREVWKDGAIIWTRLAHEPPGDHDPA